MHPTQLFVYGTLRHDQPEHAKYCRGVTGWRPARMRAQLWLVPAGYRLAVVPSTAVLLTATHDAVADEALRHGLSDEALARAVRALEESAAPWIDGELLSFRDAAEAWPALDRWEEFTPGGPGCYSRANIPVEILGAGESRTISAWAYIATSSPVGSVLVNG